MLKYALDRTLKWTLTTANGSNIDICSCNYRWENDIYDNPENNFRAFCMLWDGAPWFGYSVWSDLKVNHVNQEMLNLTCSTDQGLLIDYCQLEVIATTIQPTAPKPENINSYVLIPSVFAGGSLLMLILFCCPILCSRRKPMNTTETVDISENNTVSTVSQNSNSQEESNARDMNQRHLNRPFNLPRIQFRLPIDSATSSENENQRHTTTPIDSSPRHTTARHNNPLFNMSQENDTTRYIRYIRSQRIFNLQRSCNSQRPFNPQRSFNPQRTNSVFTIEQISAVYQTDQIMELNPTSLEPPSYTSLFPTNPPPYHSPFI
ncbi:uncharacterized protein LOC131934859 isoform X2 [Physella acuta]|nr:uncharacterized protein LOC131934859 isoform X2 [Physella acuta]